MAKKFRLKKGDQVVVLAGKDKGTEGEIVKVLRDRDRVVVSGVALATKHMKPGARSNGGIEEIEAPIHISNVALIDPEAGPDDVRGTRVGYRIGEDGVKRRVAKRSGAVLDQ